MIFLSSAPIKTQITNTSKIILLTQRQLIFSDTSSFQKSFSISIVGSFPKTFYFSTQKQEVLVQTSNTIEIYYCDWETTVRMKRVMILQDRVVHSIFYHTLTGWNIYLDSNAPQETQITMKELSFQKLKSENVLGSCFVKTNQYILTNKRLLRNSIRGQIDQIEWKRHKKIVKELGEVVKMQGNSSQKVRICLNEKYILLIENLQVILTSQRKQISFFDNSLILSQKGKLQYIDEENKIQQIKTNFNGSFCAGQFSDNFLHYLEYQGKKMFFKKCKPKIISTLQLSQRKQQEDNLFSDESGTSRKGETQNEERISEVQSGSSYKVQSLMNSDKHLFQSKRSRKNVFKNSEELSRYSENQSGTQTPFFASLENPFEKGQFLKVGDMQFDVNSSHSAIIEESFENQSFIMNDKKKIQAFKPEGATLTKKMAENIQELSYVKLLRQVWSENETKFKKLLKQFAWQIVKEEESFIFFAEYIVGETKEEIKNEIRRIFDFDGSDEEKRKIVTFSLRQFKLNEIPEEYLSYSQDFVHVFQILHLEVYITDLIQASKELLKLIVQSYLNIKSLQCLLNLEDETIDISNPRNFLNVLLYINEYLNLKVEDVFEVYCDKMIDYDYLEAILKIQEHHAFEICNVSKNVLDDLIIDKIGELFLTKPTEKLCEIVNLMSEEFTNTYFVKLSVANELKEADVNFYPIEVFEFKENNNLNLFLTKIIEENEAKKLANLKFLNIYKGLYWLARKEKINKIPQEDVKIIKMLAEKFARQKMFIDAFSSLNYIINDISNGYIASILFKYGELSIFSKIGKQPIKDLKSILTNYQVDEAAEQTYFSDKKYKSQSEYFKCNYQNFQRFFSQYFKNQGLAHFVFENLVTAKELFSQIQGEEKEKFQQFLTKISQNIVEIKSEKNLSLEKINSNPSIEEQMLLLESGKMIKKVQKSKTAKKFSLKSSGGLHLSLSKKFSQSDRKYGEYEKQKIQNLRELYQKKQKEELLEVLKNKKFKGIYFLEEFQEILELNLEINVLDIIPFEFFQIDNELLAFDLIQEEIDNRVSVRNFWIIFTIIQHLLGLGQLVNLILLNKIVVEQRSDDCAFVVEKLLQSTSFIGDEDLEEVQQMAQVFNLKKISLILKRKIDELK